MRMTYGFRQAGVTRDWISSRPTFLSGPWMRKIENQPFLRVARLRIRRARLRGTRKGDCCHRRGAAQHDIMTIDAVEGLEGIALMLCLEGSLLGR